MEKVLFKEEQKFGPIMQLVLLPGLIFTLVIFGIGFYKNEFKVFRKYVFYIKYSPTPR